MSPIIYVLACLLMLVGGVLMLLKGRKNAEYEIIAGRLSGVIESTHTSNKKRSWLDSQLLRSGLNIKPETLKIILIAAVVVYLLISIFVSAMLGLIVLAASVLIAYLILSVKYQKRQKEIIQQLPRFLDHVLRSMQVGKTLGDSLSGAIESVDDPLRSILEGAQRNILLGVSLPDAFQEIADDYDLQELQILAMGLKVNFRFGGSMTDFLNNIITYIRERDKFKRQLMAMTGETRVSAVVLSLVPIAIGSYILVSNPDYLLTMWNDPAGRKTLFFAAGLQISGIFIMWRMLKSI